MRIFYSKLVNLHNYKQIDVNYFYTKLYKFYTFFYYTQTYVNGPRRYANCIRYALAKFSATHRLFEFCKRHSLPLAAVEQLRKDDTSLYWVLANNKKKSVML